MLKKVCSGNGGILRDMVGVISSPRQVKSLKVASLNVSVILTRRCRDGFLGQSIIGLKNYFLERHHFFILQLFYNPKHGPCLFQVTITLQPQQYPHGMDCRWVIVAPPGHIIKLTWMTFNLEESHTCSYDYLAVFDNTTIPGTGRQTRFTL